MYVSEIKAITGNPFFFNRSALYISFMQVTEGSEGCNATMESDVADLDSKT